MNSGAIVNSAIAGILALGLPGCAPARSVPPTFELYLIAPGDHVWVGSFAELGPGRHYLDYSSGRFTPLTESDAGLLGKAHRVTVRSEDVSFRNNDVRLAGKLTLPDGQGPFPAVVLIHGSNDQDRDSMDPWVGFFVSRGLAVLSYDKRGVRESSGDWKTSDFSDLAADALAGVDLARKHRSVDPRKVGLFGISQAGWIAPLVVSRDSSIAFTILHAGAALPVAINNLLFIESELRAYGFPASEIEDAMAYYRLDDQVTRDATLWPKLRAAFDSAQAREVEWLLEEPQPPDSWYRRFYQGIMDFDPASVWADVRSPLLAFFGELDHNVPPKANTEALRRALPRETLDRSTLLVLPQANHLFLRAETGTRDEYPRLTHLVDGYFSEMGRWLERQLTN